MPLENMKIVMKVSSSISMEPAAAVEVVTNIKEN